MKQTALSPLALRRAKVSNKDIAPKGKRVTVPTTGVSHIKMMKVDETSSPESICEAMKEALSLCYPRRLTRLFIRHSRGWYQYEAMLAAFQPVGVTVHVTRLNSRNRVKWMRKTEMLRNVSAYQTSARITQIVLARETVS